MSHELKAPLKTKNYRGETVPYLKGVFRDLLYNFIYETQEWLKLPYYQADTALLSGGEGRVEQRVAK